MIEPVSSGKTQSKSTVLFVDDDPSLRKAALRLLRSMGFEGLVAEGGGEAALCRG
jgi:CheY-like chemotaxis protein